MLLRVNPLWRTGRQTDNVSIYHTWYGHTHLLKALPPKYWAVCTHHFAWKRNNNYWLTGRLQMQVDNVISARYSLQFVCSGTNTDWEQWENGWWCIKYKKCAKAAKTSSQISWWYWFNSKMKQGALRKLYPVAIFAFKVIFFVIDNQYQLYENRLCYSSPSCTYHIGSTISRIT